MANSIDLIVSKEAQKQLDDLYKSLTKTHEEVVAISKLQLSFNGGQSPKSVTDLNDKIKENIRLTGELSAAERKLLTDTNKLETQKQKIIATQIKEIALRQKLTQETNKNEQALAREKAKLEASQSLYNKAQQKLNQLNAEYKNLAIQKELSGKLTDSESKRYEFLSGKITKYDQALKAVDAQMGKYQRNVGNYASAFNPLNNSINQLSREMPAFANSVQTGFMAISNNLPIFFDSISGIIDKNKELRAEGKPTESVFKQLAGALFSWGTALSVGVTLLTLYGKDIVEFFATMAKGSNSIKSASQNQTELNAAIKEGTKGGIQEASQLDILYRTATNLSLSLEQRNKAVIKMQELYPSYFGNLTKEEILTGKAKDQYLQLRDAIFDSARAKAIQGKLEERASERIVKELEIKEQIKSAEEEILRLQKSGQDLTIKGSRAERTADVNISNAELIQAQKRLLAIRLNDLKTFNKNAIKEDEILLNAQGEYYKKSEKLEADRIKVKEKNHKKEKQIKREDIKSVSETLEMENSYLQTLKEQLAVYQKTQQMVSDTGIEYKAFQEIIDGLQKSIDEMTKTPDLLPMIDTSKMADTKKILADLAKEQEGYLKGFYDQFGSESGMPTLFKVLNKEINGFGDNWKVTATAMMEIGQELTNTLMKQSEARFNAEYSRLEQQKNVSLAFAGSSATAKAEIERQYEEKRKSIQRRQAESEKKQAMFNIAINTAQAVMATLGKGGFFASPLAIAVAAIGAAQLAMVASQEIPAFAEGGIHEGGKMLINDAKGSKYQETVVTPDGKIRQFKGRNKVVDAPKGTQIFTPDQWSKQINNLLLKNNISPLQTNQTNGINKDDLESVFRKYSGSNEVAIDINENGFKKMISSNGRTREILNSRLTTKGRIV